MRLTAPRWFDELPSTNSWLLQRLRDDAPEGDRVVPGLVVAARRQTAGRGRQGRTWLAGDGRDLAVSLAMAVPGEDPRRLGGLAMALALGVADWIESLGGRARVKWPNDVQADSYDHPGTWGKIAGILVESTGRFAAAGVVGGG